MLKNPTPGVCVKEMALNVVNESIFSEKPISFYGVEIERNPHYSINSTEELLPIETSARSLKLNDILHDKIEEFLNPEQLNSIWILMHLKVGMSIRNYHHYS